MKRKRLDFIINEIETIIADLYKKRSSCKNNDLLKQIDADISYYKLMKESYLALVKAVVVFPFVLIV